MTVADPSLIPETVGPRFKRHDGSAAGPDDDFLVTPDPSIGEVVSASTNRTLRGYHKGTSNLVNRIALAVLGLIFGGMVSFAIVRGGVDFLGDLLDLDMDRDLLSLAGLAGGAVGGIVFGLVGFFFPLLFRKPTATWVGKQGVMRRIKKRTELLRFADADELKVARTRHYYNGAYTGTSYDYAWFKNGARMFRINGRYHDGKNVSPVDPVNFAFAAERAWTGFRLRQIEEQMKREGVVRFRAGGDWLGVGDGFIEIGWRGAVEQLPKAAIQSLTLSQGTLIIKRQGAKEGLFRSEGVFRFPVAGIGDFRTFLVVLEVFTGFKFD
ncbi:MAG: hypothetical protein KC776_42540 [Myxococcales bacterium]|nr:hypothetical protein [Myxococcales bacterium]MCB9582920.1 hypothetical protein [Polyangiaceae bacterium]